jgi:hypothetical protein
MRNKIKNIFLLLTILLLVCIIIESCSFLILKYSSKFQFTFPYFNQQISPYYVFENTPGFNYKNCIKSNPVEPDATIDQYGFISGTLITKQKKPNTIRIFLTGGSGPFGSGQLKPYNKIKSYPWGTYSFESSIAGLLQKKLKKIFPDKNIEVINACAVKRMLHQSVAYYLETISEFNPDFVISIDGNNDISSMCGISPYLKGSMDFPAYIKLYEITELNQNKSFSNIINLIHALKIYNLKNKEKTNDKDICKDNFNSSFDSSTYNDYTIRKEKFITGSRKFINLIKYYQAICKSDNVNFIFCLQPLLYRQKFNKTLSLSEKEMQKNFFITKPSADINNKYSPEFFEMIFRESNLIIKYFIDDYLSEKINQISVEDGFSYIDMNKEIMSVQSNIDIFVDYCHLTPDGNAIIAEILKNKITEILRGKNKQQP